MRYQNLQCLYVLKFIFNILLHGGKQWQTTPKKVPRMQRTRAIPVASLGSGSAQTNPGAK